MVIHAVTIDRLWLICDRYHPRAWCTSKYFGLALQILRFAQNGFWRLLRKHASFRCLWCKDKQQISLYDYVVTSTICWTRTVAPTTEHMLGRQAYNEFTGKFEVQTGVKQGDTLLATLFSIAMDTVLKKMELRGNVTRLRQCTVHADDILITARTTWAMIDTFVKLKMNP